jgi:hypothetical protein
MCESLFLGEGACRSETARSQLGIRVFTWLFQCERYVPPLLPLPEEEEGNQLAVFPHPNEGGVLRERLVHS